MFWLLMLAAIPLFLYYFLIKPQQYWRDKNVIQGAAIPLVGDTYKVFIGKESMHGMFDRIYKRSKNYRYAGFYQLTTPGIILCDPDLIKQITVKDFDHFVDHREVTPKTGDEVWHKNLFSLKGEEWREMRSTLSPTFTSSKMRSMFNLMEKSAQQYVEFYLNQNEDIIELELKDSLTRFANDVIANCAFGISVDSLKEPTNSFYTNGKEITDLSGFWKSFKMLFFIFAPKVSEYFELGIFPKYTGQFFKRIVRDTVKVREAQKIIRPDMINLLMQARKGQLKYEESTEQKDAGFATVEESHVGKTEQARKFEMTENDMAAQVLIFFFAGFETISTMMSFLFYELAVNPDVQDRLRQEVDETYDESKGKLTYDLLNKMKYLDMVVTEGLRKNSPVLGLDRICAKTYTIHPERPDEVPLVLNPGDGIWVPVTAIHHDSQYYPNPEKFDPERFSDQNKANIKPYTYLPFGVGPRNCIGSRFALMEVKTLTYHILRKFELTVVNRTTIPMKLSKKMFNPYIEGGFWVGFKRREN